MVYGGKFETSGHLGEALHDMFRQWRAISGPMPPPPARRERGSRCRLCRTARCLAAMSLDGTDEQLGDVEDFGWYGLLVNTGLRCAPHAILSIDGFGFVDYQDYDTESAARDVWDNLEAEYTEFLEECKDGSNQGERGR